MTSRAYFVVILLFLFVMFPSYAQTEVSNGTVQGKFELVRDAELDSTCIAYKNNLNMSSNLDFGVCNSRLSERFPRFSRPEWAEMPFDLDMAEKIVIGNMLRRHVEKAEVFRRKWLKDTEQLRRDGAVKMWRLSVDVNGDGTLETLLRLDDGRRAVAVGGPSNCLYRDAYIYLLDGNDELIKNFDRSGHIGDLIYDAETGGHLLIKWSTNPTIGNIWERGHPVFAKNATGGVAVYKVIKNLGPIAICNIQWVPSVSRAR
jgi:hypothetical protein